MTEAEAGDGLYETVMGRYYLWVLSRSRGSEKLKKRKYVLGVCNELGSWGFNG